MKRPQLRVRLLLLSVLVGLTTVGVVGATRPAHAAYPGKAGKIAFSSYRDGNAEIYVMNADGSSQTNLTNTPASEESFPRWSPDGTKIAFEGGPNWSDEEIYVMNADGTSVTRLTNNGVWDGHPTWSPDGSKIAFASIRDGNVEIYVMNADGTGGQTNLTNNPGFDERPAWSPDGSKIAFDEIFDIYVMNADGSGQTNLTNNPAVVNGHPTWSPDGTKIAFFSYRVGLPNSEIYLMNADGSGQTNLTNNPAFDSQPAWSPDGTKIAFDSDRDGNAEIYVMNADGSGQTNLTKNSAVDAGPDWQPLHYAFGGFFAPVDNPPVFNVANAGRAIPVKFSLNGNQGLSIFASSYPKSQPVTCDASATYDGIEQTVTAGSSSLSYDAAIDQYVYVWKTDKAWANTCRKLTVWLNDSTYHFAYFRFTN